MREIADNLRADAPWNHSGERLTIEAIYLSDDKMGVCVDVSIDDFGEQHDTTLTDTFDSEVYVDALDDRYGEWEAKEVKWENGVVEIVGVGEDGVLFTFSLSDDHYREFAEREA